MKTMQDTKSYKRILIWNIIGIILILVILLLAKHLYRQSKIKIYNEVVSEYLQINNYQDAKDLFERDLENKELKYFTYGMAYYKPYYRKLERKYGLEIFHMGCIIEGILSKYNFYVEERILDYKYNESTYLTKADSIWTYFIEALDTKDYDYLTFHASDTVFVSNGLLDDSINEKYEARYLFERYSDSIARLDYLSTNSSNDDRDSLIYFFRKIESVSSNKEPFNLRLCFIRKGNKYYFNELVIF